MAPAVPYRYVLFHFAFITVTRRSVNLAIAASCLTFTALQARTPSREHSPRPDPNPSIIEPDLSNCKSAGYY